jgi:hypothetical protein
LRVAPSTPEREDQSIQYLVNVIDYRSESGTAEEQAAIDVFTEKLIAGGNWVFAAGLADPTTSTVIDGRGNEPVSTDGPFIEAKESAGFWVIEAPDLDIALALMAEGPRACNQRRNPHSGHLHALCPHRGPRSTTAPGPPWRSEWSS